MMETMKYAFECAVCETKIRVIEDGRLIKTEDYNEIELKLNTLSFITVGVCSKHTKPKKDELVQIEKKVKLGWQEEIERGIGNPEWVKNTGMHLKIVGIK